MNNPDEHWCRLVYEEKGPALLLYGRALGLSHSEAEDVLQETFAALLKMESRPGQPSFYAVRAYRNRALSFRQTLWRRLRREWESISWFDSCAETDVEHQKMAMAVDCLQRLPAPQREVIVLKIWHAHTFDEIGDLLGISPNTAAGRYRYGLEKIRHCLSGSDQPFYEDNRRTIEVPAPQASIQAG